RSPQPDKPSLVLVWDLEGKQLHRLDGHRAPVGQVAFSAGGRRLLSWSQERWGTPGNPFVGHVPGAVCVWEMPSGKLLARLAAEGSEPVFSPDGKSLALTGKDRKVHLWDLDARKRRAALPGVGLAYLFLPSGKALATGGGREMVCLWDADGKKLR